MVEYATELEIAAKHRVFTDYPKLVEMAKCAYENPRQFCPKLGEIEFFSQYFNKYTNMEVIVKVNCGAITTTEEVHDDMFYFGMSYAD